MNSNQSLVGFLVAVCLASLVGGEAEAAATIGGVTSVLAGNGSCNDSHLVPGSTSQDTFALSSATACSGGSASADIRGDAATASIGLRATSSGNGFGSSRADAQVQFTDRWLLSGPASTPINSYVKIPVSIRLDGSISPAAVFDVGALGYSLFIGDFYHVLRPGSSLFAHGRLTTSGVYSLLFEGDVDFFNFGPGSLPMSAQVELNLDVGSLLEGTVDFYNTASVSLKLPPGFSATTSSGVPLVFAPVPEPGTVLLMLAGLSLLWRRSRRRADVGPNVR